MGAVRHAGHRHQPGEELGADAPALPGVLDEQSHLGLVAVPQQVAEADDAPEAVRTASVRPKRGLSRWFR